MRKLRRNRSPLWTRDNAPYCVEFPVQLKSGWRSRARADFFIDARDDSEALKPSGAVTLLEISSAGKGDGRVVLSRSSPARQSRQDDDLAVHFVRVVSAKRARLRSLLQDR